MSNLAQFKHLNKNIAQNLVRCNLHTKSSWSKGPLLSSIWPLFFLEMFGIPVFNQKHGMIVKPHFFLSSVQRVHWSSVSYYWIYCQGKEKAWGIWFYMYMTKNIPSCGNQCAYLQAECVMCIQSEPNCIYKNLFVCHRLTG